MIMFFFKCLTIIILERCFLANLKCFWKFFLLRKAAQAPMPIRKYSECLPLGEKEVAPEWIYLL